MPSSCLGILKEKPLSQINKMIAVAAGKGGVGKSSVAVNLALSLHQLGEKVGILDADLYGPSICRMLPDHKLAKESEGILQPAWSFGLRTLSMGHFRSEEKAILVRAPIANGIINQFLFQTAWGELDTLIVDFPPGTGDIPITLAQKGDFCAALMVSTPQEMALMDVRKAMHLFEQQQIPILGIIENMSYLELPNGEKFYPFGRGGAERLAQEYGVPYLGEIPLDPLYSRFSDEGSSLFEKAPHLGLPFLKLARRLNVEVKELRKKKETNALY